MSAPTNIELAAATGVKPQQVKRDKRKGAPTGSVEEYVAWRRSNVRQYSGGPNRVSYSVGEETSRLRRAQAEAVELENAERRAELVATEDMAMLLLSIGTIFKSQLEAQPARVAHELAALSEPALVAARLADENRRILEAIGAEVDKFREQLEAARDAAGAVEAGEEPDAGSVGRQHSHPPSRLRGAGPIP